MLDEVEIERVLETLESDTDGGHSDDENDGAEADGLGHHRVPERQKMTEAFYDLDR